MLSMKSLFCVGSTLQTGRSQSWITSAGNVVGTVENLLRRSLTMGQFYFNCVEEGGELDN